MNDLKLVFLAGTFLLLTACADNPLPLDRQDYAGHWWAPNMQITITPMGRVSYKREQGMMSKSVEGPIQRFVGDDFDVGVWVFSTQFKVSRRPYRDGNKLKMVVDGIELYRTRVFDPPPPK